MIVLRLFLLSTRPFAVRRRQSRSLQRWYDHTCLAKYERNSGVNVDVGEEDEDLVCVEFRDTGNCEFGQMCRYLHPMQGRDFGKYSVHQVVGR